MKRLSNELNIAAHAVDIVVVHGKHKKSGKVWSTQSPLDCLKSIGEELIELASAAKGGECYSNTSVLEEVADVLIGTFDFCHKMGYSHNQIAFFVVAKLRERNYLPPKQLFEVNEMLDRISEGGDIGRKECRNAIKRNLARSVRVGRRTNARKNRH